MVPAQARLRAQSRVASRRTPLRRTQEHRSPAREKRTSQDQIPEGTCGSPRFSWDKRPTLGEFMMPSVHHSNALAAKLSALTNPYAVRLSTAS
jgi:hypothetical protein